ncbi:MAG: hypothetical protein ACE5JU_22455, partial [Candidatus Binatia bacterium]
FQGTPLFLNVICWRSGVPFEGEQAVFLELEAADHPTRKPGCRSAESTKRLDTGQKRFCHQGCGSILPGTWSFAFLDGVALGAHKPEGNFFPLAILVGKV